MHTCIHPYARLHTNYYVQASPAKPSVSDASDAFVPAFRTPLKTPGSMVTKRGGVGGLGCFKTPARHASALEVQMTEKTPVRSSARQWGLGEVI